MNARDPLMPVPGDANAALAAFAARAWDEQIVPAMTDYIAIPAKSPMFDAQWAQHGHLERVARDAAAWVERQKVAGLKLEIVRLEGRTPLIFFEVPATRPDATGTVLMYGHLDKQPEFNGWRNDLGPWTPVYEDGKLYGRGSADDGYAVYASIAAVQALKSHMLLQALATETADASDDMDGIDANPNDPPKADPSIWLMPLRQTLRQALLAELDTRLQPSLGLLEALTAQAPRTP
jgi:hypothetical protein